MGVAYVGVHDLLPLRCQGIGAQHHLAPDGVLHPPEPLRHGGGVPGVLLARGRGRATGGRCRLGRSGLLLLLPPRNRGPVALPQIGLEVVHGLDVGIPLPLVELGGPDEPGLELGVGDGEIDGGIPDLILGGRIHSPASDVVNEEGKLCGRD